ncbi:alpha-catulin isoform X3 [Paroedura picta]|uniref:alpha-catulin isoform X3 n=1 Tax=Paroedura picta TaxID=143630 RepID=UPI004057C449
MASSVGSGAASCVRWPGRSGSGPGPGPGPWGWEALPGLQIRSRSVEQTLVPLVAQITTLINHKDKPKRSDKTLRAVQQVGQAVNVAVGRFVTVGEAIAKENQELKEEMKVACFEAKRAGETIAQLTDIAALDHPESDGQITIFTDKTGVTKAARLLLSSVTKVLVMADRIVIKQIVTSRNKVLLTMEQLEKVSTFQEFVQIFSQFGNEMVEFAHLTGDRQNDLKDEKKKAKMAAARTVLEKCTMMLLTASKTCLRHPDCESARVNKGAVFHRMRLALERVIVIVTDSCPSGQQEPVPMSIYAGIKEFKNKVESLRDNLYLLSKESLRAILRGLLEHTEDFTDSAYTSHENREHILELSQQAEMELEQLLSAWMYAQSQKKRDITEDLEVALLKMCQCMNELQREICHLLRHVSGTEPLEITCLHAEDTFKATGPQIISAAETLALHPSSKIAKENLEVFCEAWESQLREMFLLLREISDVFEGRRGYIVKRRDCQQYRIGEKRAYLSLPRLGKHNTNLKVLKPAQLESEEQASLGKSGIPLCELSSRFDSELENWDDPENDLVRHGQCLSSMAYSMYLFTRGEGLLKTTQDLFQQAEAFATEGLKLVSALLAFSNQLEEEDRLLLLQEIEKIVPAYRQLQVTAQAHVQGKPAIFTKVDACLQEAEHMLRLLLQVLPLSCKLLRKRRAGNSYLRGPHPWREKSFQATTEGHSSPAGSPTSLGIESLEQHGSDLTLLENKHF